MNYLSLKTLVNKHNHLYYDLSAPEITDAEFDRLYDMLVDVENTQGWKAPDSPTLLVGGAAGKITHPYKLYSLRKVYDIEEVDSFYDIKTPKIDGTNITLIYRYGRLRLAVTRGNGEKGDNVTHLVKTIKNIPKYIDTELDFIVINGECVTDNNVDNFRNYVSGALGLKSATEFQTRNIVFIAHDVLNLEFNYKMRMNIIEHMGFLTVFNNAVDKYPHDGVVYRIDNYKKCVELGYTSKYPKFAVALKPRGLETAITTLQDVVWAVGRTGTVNPTGIISPVILDDATITRVTLHNIDIIMEHNLGLGDTIEIERAGGVIPKFIRVVEHANHNIKITKEHAEQATGIDLVNKGPKLMIKDPSNVNTAKVLEHFIKTMEIKGLGPASVKKMGFTHILDLYDENDWSILGANGVKVAEEIEKSKQQPYDIVLAALGIKGVGRSVTKLIVTKIPSFYYLKEIETTEIKGIGPATVSSILEWLEDNEDWVSTLPLNLVYDTRITEILTGNSKKICITGKLDMSRNELIEILEKSNFVSTSTVTKDCYALINAGDKSSSKYTKAAKQGTTIIDYWSRKKDVLTGNF